eukprot:Gb_21582 [translate_table: standard]
MVTQIFVVLDEDDEQPRQQQQHAHIISPRWKDIKIYYPARDHLESVEICHSDMQCLAPCSYLSSPIMNFYIQVYIEYPNYSLNGIHELPISGGVSAFPNIQYQIIFRLPKGAGNKPPSRLRMCSNSLGSTRMSLDGLHCTVGWILYVLGESLEEAMPMKEQLSERGSDTS